MIFSICDSGNIHVLNVMPDMYHIQKTGCFYFQGILREVRDIHRTQKGIQIELIS